ncbi:MAG: tetratricopeptide repeat protein, partial [Geobacter sp.]
MMKKLLILTLLLLLTLLTCAFDWGFGTRDKCGEAKKIAAGLNDMKSEDSRDEAEARIRKLCPDGVASRFLTARNLELAGNTEQAITEYLGLLTADPEFPAANGNLGLLYLQKGLVDEAAVELTKALKGGADPRYNKGLARIFGPRKLFALAGYHYREALKAFPGDAALHMELAGIYADMGLFDNADEEYRKTLSIEPDNETARLGLAAAYAGRNQFDAAVAEMRKALAANPGNKEIHRLLAEVYEKKGDRKSAEEEYLLTGKVGEGRHLRYSRRGDEYLAAKDYDKAVAEYKAALQEKPEWPEVMQKLGDVYKAAGRDDDALGAYKEAIRLKGE